MAKCLVTGAAGFIGSHLCDRLLREEHTVMGVDDLSTGRMENLEEAGRSKLFDFAQATVEDISWMVEASNFDYVFHLAARADVVPSIENPLTYHSINVTETVRLLDACRDTKIKKFVYAASSSCYGIPTAANVPTDEYADINCQYPYAMTKNIGEQYALHWARVYKIPTVSLRLFNVYGPRSRTKGAYGAAFGVFLSQIANGLPVTIVGDGEQTRDFTFVTDVCEAFVRAAYSQYDHEIFNIGSGGTYSVRAVSRLLGATVEVGIPDRPGEPRVTYANIGKAARLLGYSPKVSIAEGCGRMRDIMLSYKDAPLWTPDKIAAETKSWFQYLGAR